MFAIFKREFKAYFQTVIGWLVTAAMLALYGLYFYYYSLRSGYPYISYSLGSATIIMVIAIPILTMKSFSEDRKTKTDQLMLTAPVSLGKVVMGKYLAMVAVFSVDVLIFALTPLLLMTYGTVPLGESYVALLGYWLYGCACIAVGMFVSSLTESQIIAAIVSFGVLFLSYMMQSITGLISTDGNVITKILDCFDLYAPFDNFTSGCLDVAGIVYYLTVILLFCFLTSQSIQKRRWSMSAKKIATGVFSVGFIVVAIALSVAVNLVVSVMPETYTSIDCSYTQIYAISDTTTDYLKTLDQDITIYVLNSEKSKDEKVDETLLRYESLSDHIKVKYINPSTNPNFYQTYTDEAPSTNSLIVVSDQRSRVIDISDIYETEVDYTTYSQTITGYDAEGQITSAIEYVTMDSDTLPVVYEITGHEETSIGTDFQEALEKANITLESLELINEESVPSDASIIIINGPTVDFSEDDAQKVIDYLEAGGKAIISGCYGYTDLTNFNSILEAYGEGFVSGLVCENDSTKHLNTSGGEIYVLPTINSSDYTTDVASDSYTLVPQACAITYDDSSEDVTYTSLLETSDQAVAKTGDNITSTEYEDGDIEGPFTLAVAATKAVDDDTTTEIVTFASPYFFNDTMDSTVYNGNSTMFTDIVSEMVGDVELSSSVIPVKEYTVSNLTVTAGSGIFFGILGMIILPIAMIILGIVIWAVRRKK